MLCIKLWTRFTTECINFTFPTLQLGLLHVLKIREILYDFTETPAVKRNDPPLVFQPTRAKSICLSASLETP